MSKLDYIQGSVRLGVFYQQQSRRRRYCFSWRMPRRIWTVVSLLTQVAESIFNGLGIFWFSKGKKWYNCCISAYLLKKPQNSIVLRRESREADFSVYSSKLYAAATLTRKPTSLICCQGQTQVLLRLYKTSAASLCHVISLSSTQTHLCITCLKTLQYPQKILKHRILDFL